MSAASMALKVLLPSQVLVDEPVAKINAEGADGRFCLLPRHADYVTALALGLFFGSHQINGNFVSMD